MSSTRKWNPFVSPAYKGNKREIGFHYRGSGGKPHEAAGTFRLIRRRRVRNLGRTIENGISLLKT